MPKDSSAFKRAAHRGASGEAPENTLPAIRLAVEKYEVDQVEVDLRISKEGVPVVFHDAALERVTNGKGAVRHYSVSELKRFDAGFSFDPDGKGAFPFRAQGVTIPTLEEMLLEFPETPFCFEIKEKNPEFVERVIDTIHRVPKRAPLLLGSFYGSVVREIRRLCPPSIESTLSRGEVIRSYVAFRLGLRKFSSPSRFAYLPPDQKNVRLDRADWIEFLHRQGVQVFYWTVNETSEMERLIQRGADGILTDYPGRLNEVCSKMRLR